MPPLDPNVLVALLVLFVICRDLLRPVPIQIASNGGTIHNETQLCLRGPL